MIKVLFVCHGNICRSTMAEFVFADMVKKRGLSDRISVDSAATSTEELGNPPHRGTVEKLRREGVPMYPHHARQMTKHDYQSFDLLIGMDMWNRRNMTHITGGDPDGKIFLLLEFANSSREIADPWYTGNFDETYRDVVKGCYGLMVYLLEKEKGYRG